MPATTPRDDFDPPQITPMPGSAQDVLRELAPYLALEGVDLRDPTRTPLTVDELNSAFARALQRQQLEAATPIGDRRASTAAALGAAVSALVGGDAREADGILANIPAEAPPDNATVISVIGLALGALDGALGPAHEIAAPQRVRAITLPMRTDLSGRRAAQDVLGLAARGRAHELHVQLIAQHGGKAVLYGSTIALATVTKTWGSVSGLGTSEILDRHLFT